MKNIRDFVKELTEIHGNKRESLLSILQDIVERDNYLTSEAMREVARVLDISSADVFGTASFYSFLDTKPRGKYVIRVCKTITCDMKGKNEILKTMEDMLKIKVGETTEGKRFSLQEANCLGWCHEAPAMLINNEVYTKLTPAKVRKVLGEYIRNKY